MSKRQLSFNLALLAAVLLHLHRLHAADLCDPNRKFCGRLLIIIEGAGEILPYKKGTDEHESAGESITSRYAYSIFETFRRNNPKGTPSCSIIVSSDPQLKQKVEKNLSKTTKQESGFLGVIPSSVESIEELLSDDSHVSLIQSAIDKLSQCPECKSLTGTDRAGVVLPFLKTEIFIVSENAEASGGIPLWTRNDQEGSLEDWQRLNDRKTFGPDSLKRLRDRFGAGVVQFFIETCKGAAMASRFTITDAGCSCYLSATNARTFISASPNRRSIFVPTSSASARRDVDAFRGDAIHGAVSVTDLAAQMWPLFQRQTVNENDDISEVPLGAKEGASIFAAGNDINPLQPFVYTSADEDAEKILRQLISEDIASLALEKLLEAGFIEQLPPAFEVPTGKSNADLTKLLTITKKLRHSYPLYTNGKTKQSLGKESSFADYLKKFRQCTKMTNPQPAVCATIRDLILVAAKGSAAGNRQTKADISLVVRRDEFLKEFDDQDAPSLIKRYEKEEITPTDLFMRLTTLHRHYWIFRQELLSYANNYYHHEWPSASVQAYREMNHQFQMGLYLAQQAFFPLLLKNALEVRVARIEEAAKLLAIHGDEIKGLDAKAELRQLENDLVCLTAFPLGPAFDAKDKKN